MQSKYAHVTALAYPTFELPMTSRMRHLIAPALLVLALGRSRRPPRPAPTPSCAIAPRTARWTASYSNADKRAALKKIPADLDEYSDCRSAISGSIGSGPKAGSAKSKGDSGGGAAGSSGGGDGGTPTIDADTNGDGKVTDAEKAAAGKTDLALKQDAKRKDTETSLGDRKTDPTKVGAIDASETSNGVTAPVIASIAALALLAAWRRCSSWAAATPASLRPCAVSRFRASSAASPAVAIALAAVAFGAAGGTQVGRAAPTEAHRDPGGRRPAGRRDPVVRHPPAALRRRPPSACSRC